MTQPFELTDPIGTKGTLGLVVLQTDVTLENDFRRLFPDRAVAIHATRIPSGAEVTPETLRQMEIDLPAATALLPPTTAFDVIAYGCTSGATLIGPQRVHGLVSATATVRDVTDPLTALLAALAALGVTRLGIVSPYIPSVADRLRDALVAEGKEVPETLSFGEVSDARVGRIDPASTVAAALEVGRTPGLEAVFMSCTNLRTIDVIDEIEAALGLPVLSSNQVLAWHMARLAGSPVEGVGRLFGAPLA